MSTRPTDAVARAPCRVLVVDDNELNVMLVKTLLSAERFEVAVAGDAQQAVAVAASFRPRLILMDLELPGTDGLTLARQLKADSATCDIRIVVLSAHAARDVEAAVREAGCEGFMSKPVDPRTFGGTVRRYLGEAPP